MRRVTPTGLARQRGKVVPRLGSLRAVLEAMNWDGVVIFANASNAQHRLFQEIADAKAGALFSRAEGARLVPFYASSGIEALLRIPPDTVIGVDDDAFTGIPSEMWADMQRLLSTRFATVHWA